MELWWMGLFVIYGVMVRCYESKFHPRTSKSGTSAEGNEIVPSIEKNPHEWVYRWDEEGPFRWELTETCDLFQVARSAQGVRCQVCGECVDLPADPNPFSREDCPGGSQV